MPWQDYFGYMPLPSWVNPKPYAVADHSDFADAPKFGEMQGDFGKMQGRAKRNRAKRHQILNSLDSCSLLQEQGGDHCLAGTRREKRECGLDKIQGWRASGRVVAGADARS
jgi:hypothetical protein